MLEAISFKNNFSKIQTRVSAEFSKVGPNTIRQFLHLSSDLLVGTFHSIDFAFDNCVFDYLDQFEKVNVTSCRLSLSQNKAKLGVKCLKWDEVELKNF